MEQATNLFTKGLQMDTHPMVQGNDTLTDCLNGTLITMNGDEVILQNDMGNRRVDLAFLPAGYEPIGMKEYGGIIYVVAYNPITNKSQIGSFPSPLRKYSYTNPIEKLISLAKCEADSNDWVKMSPKLIKISDDIIHVGDKFAFCFNDNNGNNEIDISELSNCNNTNNNGKILSPKNKLYTLSIGVLDEYGKFYDITSRLCRYKGSSGIPVSYTNNESDLYKFNDGYFIANSSVDLTSNNVGFPDSSTQDLEESRFMKIYGNTYSEKFTGPLYLKIELNYILDFTYNLEAKKVLKKESPISSTLVTAIRIKLTGKFIYNCPDGCASSSDVDDTYVSYDTGATTFDFFDFNISNPKDKEGNSISYTQSTPSVNTKVTYDKITNLYTTVVTRQWDITSNNDALASFNYDIKVKANAECSSKYIKELSSLDNYFDVSLINSNTLKLTGWRFTNDVTNRKTTIKYSLEAYPAKNVKFTNLTMTFKDVKNSSNTYIKSGIDINNGINEITINWDDADINGNYLLSRKLYDVTLLYNKINTLTGEVLPAGSLYTIHANEGGSGHHFTDFLEYDGGTIINIRDRYEEYILIPELLEQQLSQARSNRSGENGINVSNYYAGVKDKTGNTDLGSDSTYLWLLTTELLNDCYTNVNDFCEIEVETVNINGNNVNVTKLKNQEIRNKLNIKYEIKFEDIKVSKITKDPKYIGSPVSFATNNDIKYKREYHILFIVSGKYRIEYKEELYPDFVVIDINTNINTSTKDIQINRDDFINSIIELMRGEHQSVIFTNANEFLLSDPGTTITLDRSNHTFQIGNINVYYYDYLFGNSSLNISKSITIKKAVVPITDIFNRLFPLVNYYKEDFMTPSMVDNSSYSPYVVKNHISQLLTSINPIDVAPNYYTPQTYNHNESGYNGLNILNCLHLNNNSPNNSNNPSNILEYKLFTYLNPISGLQEYNENNGSYIVNFVLDGNTENIDTDHKDYVRVFIKYKTSQNSYEWVLVKYDNKYYGLIINNTTYIPDGLVDKVCYYNNKKVYVFTKLDNDGRNVIIYYSSNLISTGENTIDILLSINNNNADENIKIFTSLDFTNTLSKPFINTLEKNIISSDLINIDKVSNNSLDLDTNVAALISNNSSEILGMVVLDSSDNDINYTIIDEHNNLYYDNNFYKFYYLETSNNEKEFKPLNSKISLNDLSIISPTIESIEVYDEYETPYPSYNNPSYTDPKYYYTKILYNKCISLDNPNNCLYSE